MGSGVRTKHHGALMDIAMVRQGAVGSRAIGMHFGAPLNGVEMAGFNAYSLPPAKRKQEAA
jgi:hypothetical protein